MKRNFTLKRRWNVISARILSFRRKVYPVPRENKRRGKPRVRNHEWNLIRRHGRTDIWEIDDWGKNAADNCNQFRRHMRSAGVMARKISSGNRITAEISGKFFAMCRKTLWGISGKMPRGTINLAGARWSLKHNWITFFFAHWMKRWLRICCVSLELWPLGRLSYLEWRFQNGLSSGLRLEWNISQDIFGGMFKYDYKKILRAVRKGKHWT